MRVMRLPLAVLPLALLLVASAARADEDPPPNPRRPPDLGVLSFEVFTTRWAHAPNLVLRGDSAPRRLVGLDGGSAPMPALVGVDAAIGARFGRFTSRLLELRLAWSTGAIGDAPGVANEHGVVSHQDTMMLVEFGSTLGGQAFLGATDDWKLSFELGGGLAYARADGTVDDSFSGGGAGSFQRLGGYVRVGVAGCRRFGDGVVGDGGSSWICLTAAPALYELSPLNGVSFGVRVEL